MALLLGSSVTTMEALCPLLPADFDEKFTWIGLT
jgi:hypothetical protein